ncbi:MAG TPA: hypothetical protein GX704_02990 [Clostridiales bacterium]|jgi:hypothetical protein|nr:hypothetical protein [Clostridiales bacterium]
MKKLIIISLFFAVILLTAVNSSFAAGPASAAGPDAGVYDIWASRQLESFENANPPRGSIKTEAAAGLNIDSVRRSSELPFFPYQPFSGENFLLCKTDGGTTPTHEYYKAEVNISLSLYNLNADDKCLAYAIALPERLDASGSLLEYAVTTVIGSETGETTLRHNVYGGAWNTLFCDISTWSGRISINSLRVTVMCKEIPVGTAYSFGIDDISLFESTEAATAMNWFVPVENWYYLYAHKSDSGGMKFIPDSDEFYIETYGSGLKPGLAAGGGYLCVRLDNRCGAQNISLQHTTAERMSFAENMGEIAELSDGEQLIYFSLPKEGESEFTQLRFVFDGITSFGEHSQAFLEIKAIYPASTYKPEPDPLGKIQSCQADGSGKVTVTGTLSEYVASANMYNDVCLFQTDPTLDLLKALNGLEPIARTRASSNFRFTADGQSNYSSDRFVVALVNGKDYIIIDDSFITNPEAACASPATFKDIPALKGISTSSSPDISAASKLVYFDGASTVVFPLALERLYSPKITSVQYEYEGTTYYFDPSYCQSVQRILGSLKSSGACIYMKLTLKPTSNEALNAALCAPGWIQGSEAAFNTDTPEGMKLYRAIFSFIAARWSKEYDTRVNGYIIGDSVNEARTNWSKNGVSLEQFAYSYALTLRSAYTSMRTAAGPVRIMTSVSSLLFDGYPSDNQNRYGTGKFLSALNAAVASSGNFNWGIELAIPAGRLTAQGFSDTSDFSPANTSKISISADNYELFDVFLNRKELLFKDKTRDVIVSAAQGADEAQYAYAFYKLSSSLCDTAKALVISVPDAAAYGDTFGMIDTAETLDYTSEALNTLGYADWAQLIPGLDYNRAVSRTYADTLFSPTIPGGLNGVYALSSFDSQNDITNFSFGNGVESIEWKSGLSSREGLLMLNYALNESKNFGGLFYVLDYPLDLSKSPVLTLDIAVVSLPEGTSQAQLTVMLCSGRSSVICSGQISENGWQTAVCDLSDYKDLISSTDTIRVWLSSYDGKPLGSPSLLIDEVKVGSFTLDSENLREYFLMQQSDWRKSASAKSDLKIVYALAALASVCAVILTFRITRGIIIEKRRLPSHDEWKFD